MISGFVYEVDWLSELTSKCYCWLEVNVTSHWDTCKLNSRLGLVVTYKFTPNITAAVTPLNHEIW